MKSINKILIIQIAFIAGEIIGWKVFRYELSGVIANHIVLTMGFLYGYFVAKNRG